MNTQTQPISAAAKKAAEDEITESIYARTTGDISRRGEAVQRLLDTATADLRAKLNKTAKRLHALHPHMSIIDIDYSLRILEREKEAIYNLTAENARLREALEKIEKTPAYQSDSDRSSSDSYAECPLCCARNSYGKEVAQHKAHCPITIARAAITGDKK